MGTKITFLLMTCTLISNAQYSVSAGYTTLWSEDFWTHGATLQGNYVMPIDLGNASVTLDGSYTRFFNSGGLPTLASPTVVGFRREFSVRNYQFADVLLSLEYHDTDKSNYVILAAGVGMNYHSENPVVTHEWESPGQTVAYDFDFRRTRSFEPTYRISFGYHIRMGEHFSLRPELIYYKNTETKILRSPIECNLQYEF
jgi:hypothetical protein